MNATVTYTCPNCGAGLVFDAEAQAFKCDFCISEFTEEDLAKTGAAQKEEQKRAEQSEFEEQIDEYYCPSCGAEVIVDKSTAADLCYYCHNPIVLSAKMKGAMRPSKIIPFKFSKEEAKDRFISFARSKWFVPRDYFCGEHIKAMTGVYYPFWVTDADTDSAMDALGKKVRTWRSGDYRYTETSSFNVYRQGRIHFEDITTSALSTEDKAMLEGILPYPTDEYIDFSMPYLQGFVAKKRDIERENITGEVKSRMDNYAEQLLSSTASHYSSLTPRSLNVAILSAHWEYSLMPIWILTYKKKHGKKDKTYVYAMNGSTGKIYGELPISIPKLLLFGLGIFAAAFLAAFGLGWILFS
ncbi:MAG: TFIIB-type zinc ribbon-containing protein [Clostridia bacterium]|nr:TFIIB-type zinc ribbon-containing protein [Clostridia bacterium]